MATLFVSDLHLDPSRPALIDRFRRFVEEEARAAEHLYILGDLFEAWIGDDDDEPSYRPVVAALRELCAAGVPVSFMHGNRDFLVGAGFADATGCTLLGDYLTIELGGERVLLTHGDLLCTDDERYMALRQMVRNTRWQREFLGKRLAERRAFAHKLRETSRVETAQKPAEIMDVNPETVATVMRRHGVQRLLHGHTHRPAIHRFTLDGQPAQRVVLGAWYEQGSYCRWDTSGAELLVLDGSVSLRE